MVWVWLKENIALLIFCSGLYMGDFVASAYQTFKTFPNRPLISYSHFIFRNFRPVMGRALSGIPIYYNIYISLSLPPSLPLPLSPSPPVTYFVLRVYTMLSCMLTCTLNSLSFMRTPHGSRLAAIRRVEKECRRSHLSQVFRLGSRAP